MMACRAVVRPGQPHRHYHHHFHLYFLLSFSKIIWNIKYLVLEGWEEDLIPLPFGNFQIDRPFGWAAKGSGLKSAPLRFACIGKVSVWAQLGFCIGWEWVVELCTMKCEISFCFSCSNNHLVELMAYEGRAASCARRLDGVRSLDTWPRHTLRQENERRLDGKQSRVGARAAKA